MTFPYQLKAISLSYVGGIHIQVIEPGETPNVVFQWELPETKENSLSLLAPLDQHRFVATTETGKVFVVDCATEVVSQVANLSCRPFSGHWLDADQQQIWIAAHFSGKQLTGLQLACLCLNSGDLLCHWPIEEPDIELETLTQTEDGQFSFYGLHHKAGYKFRSHFLYRIDPSNGAQHKLPLDSKPVPVDIAIRPWLFQDKGRGLIALPYADCLQKTEDGQYEYELQLIDLNRSQILWTKSVRPFSLEQITDYDEEETEAALDRIASGKYAHTDNDHWQTLISCLTGVWFDPGKDEMWLGWQDCTLQCISLNGEQVSPLYAVGTQSRDGCINKPWDFDLDRLAVTNRKHNDLFLAYGFELEEHLQVTVPDTQKSEVEQDESQWLVAKTTTPAPLIIPDLVQSQPSLNGCIHLCCDDLETESGKRQILDRLLILLPMIETAMTGTPEKEGLFSRLLSRGKPQSETVQPLYFAFSDGLGRAQSEEQFFYAASVNSELQPLVAEAVKMFSQWSIASNVSGYEGQPPLAIAVSSLSTNPDYLPLLAQYFNAIGGGEDVHGFHINYTLATIREEHADTQALTEFLAAVPWPYNDAEFKKPMKDPYEEWDDDE